jgi:hypothetical protein
MSEHVKKHHFIWVDYNKMVVEYCPRCEMNHENLKVHEFDNPIENVGESNDTCKFYLNCPEKNEPIIITTNRPNLRSFCA